MERMTQPSEHTYGLLGMVRVNAFAAFTSQGQACERGPCMGGAHTTDRHLNKARWKKGTINMK
eukprot:1152769-Pelagomonas_calceolata.AAC.5